MESSFIWSSKFEISLIINEVKKKVVFIFAKNGIVC